MKFLILFPIFLPTDKLIETCFQNTERLLPTSKKGWERSSSTRLLHFATKIVQDIRNACQPESKHLFYLTRWQRVIAHEAFHSRGNQLDRSNRIVWHTTKDDNDPLARWICRVTEELLMSYPIDGAQTDSPEYPAQGANQPGQPADPVRDDFFGHLKVENGPGLNSIIATRFRLYLESDHIKVNRRRAKTASAADECVNLNLGDGDPIHFSSFFTGDGLNNLCKRKKQYDTPQVRSAALKNRDHWIKHNETRFDIFCYRQQDADLVDNALEDEDWHKALFYAQTGIITKKLLLTLLSKKPEYDRWRTMYSTRDLLTYTKKQYKLDR